MTKQSNEYRPAVLDDPQNITVGLARIIYVPQTNNKPGGWALPGGAMTADRMAAYAVAVRMYELMGDAK